MVKHAIFLDRDGTLIEDRGTLSDPTQVQLLPETLAALKILQRRFVLFIVTNQPGIGQGVLTADQVNTVNGKLLFDLYESGVSIRDIYVCPHLSESGCRCRKPQPELIERAAAAHRLDLTRCWSVGDHPGDAELARRVGGQGIYLLTGHGKKHRHELSDGVPVAASLTEAARIILGDVDRT